MLPERRSGTQIIKVVGGLAVAAAAVGGGLGAFLAALVVMSQEGIRAVFQNLEILAIAAGFGAVSGVVLGPAVAFGLLRRVPIGYALIGTALGTMAGFGLGITLLPARWILLSVAGFVAAAVALHLWYRKATP